MQWRNYKFRVPCKGCKTAPPGDQTSRKSNFNRAKVDKFCTQVDYVVEKLGGLAQWPPLCCRVCRCGCYATIHVNIFCPLQQCDVDWHSSVAWEFSLLHVTLFDDEESVGSTIFQSPCHHGAIGVPQNLITSIFISLTWKSCVQCSPYFINYIDSLESWNSVTKFRTKKLP